MNSQFVESMTRHFGSRPYPSELVSGWHQMAQAVTATAEKKQWQVIQWPTGTGKTEALTVLCAMPEAGRHPGALIITKFTEEADEIARKINTEAGYAIALAAHTKAATSTQAMTESPVLVITHEAYRSALREACDRPDAAVRLDLYHRYHHDVRSWIIIDEAFNWIDSYEVDLDEAHAMCAALSVQMQHDANLDQLSGFIRRLADEHSATRSDRLLPDQNFAMLASIDFDALRASMKGAPSTTFELWRNADLHQRVSEATPSDTSIRRTSFKNEYLALLSRLDAIRRIGRCWISQRSARTRLHSSRLLLDTDRPCGVLLDATASIDRMYELCGDRVTILPRPPRMRSYKNVTVHISRPHHVGKEYLAKHASADWPALIEQLSGKISAKSNALVVTHKSTKGLLKRRLPCSKQEIGHWGNLDGKNEWRHCDTVLIFGLSYTDDITPTDVFHACTGLWSADWFSGDRKYGVHVDTKAAIKHGVIARSVVQAINRAQCRTIIDDEGNCAPTDIYILLPRGTVGDTVRAAILTEMPDARIVPWMALPAKQPRITPTEQRLMSELRAIDTGVSYGKTQMIDRLSITSRTFERMSVKLRKPNSTLSQELAAIGAEFRCTVGRGKEGYFIKD